MSGRSFRLTVDGAVERPLSLSIEDLLALPAVERNVTLDCGKGTSTALTMTGLALSRLIKLAEASDSASQAVFHCTDGLCETISLAELIFCDAFLAYSGDEEPPGPGTSGVRLVVPGKFGHRWAKLVTRIEIIAGA